MTHAVWGRDEVDQSPPELFPDDLIRERDFWVWDPDVVLVEGSPFLAGEDLRWRIPKPVMERFCNDGGSLIILEVDLTTVRHDEEKFRVASNGHVAGWPFADGISWVNGLSGPVYGMDLEHTAGPSSQTIVCRPELIVIADWLRPVYEGVDALIADHPVEQIPSPGLVDVLASGNRSTTRVLAGDIFVTDVPGQEAFPGMRPQHCPFATVRPIGDGFRCFITAGVAADFLLDLGGQNDVWLANLLRFLRRSTEAEADLRRPIRAIQRAFRAA